VIEIEAFGVGGDQLGRLERLEGVETVVLEDGDQTQLVTVSHTRGAEMIPHVLGALADVGVGKVVVREPTLEDVYVELVRRP
jgi:hypothetical protein